MKLHVSVAALAAAAGAFSYGSQVRAQAITVAPVENITEGLVLEQDQNLIVNPGYSITNIDAEVAGTNAVLLQGTGYLGQRSIVVRGSIVNYDGTARAIAGANNINDASNDSVTITVESVGSISTDANGARGIVLDDNIVVSNYGSITANNVAIDVNDFSSVYNASSATIASLGAANAIQAQDNSGSLTISVTNAGDIAGGTFNRRGVSVSAGPAALASVTITNSGSGTITGGGGGVYASGGDVDLTIAGGALAPNGPQANVAVEETGFSGVIAQTFANSGHGPGYAAIEVRANDTASLSLNIGEAGAVYANNGTAIDVAGEYALVDITNAGEISSSGEFAEAGVRVNGEYGGSVTIANRSTGSIVTEYGAAVDVAIGGYDGEFEPQGSVGSGTVVINNDGQIVSNDPGQGEQAYAPGAITAYAAGAGVTINNGVAYGEVSSSSATIEAPSTHAIVLGTTDPGQGHVINNGGSILAQADGRNGGGFNARAIDIRLDGGEAPQTFALTLNNYENGEIVSRREVIGAQGDSSIVGSTIEVNNDGYISSTRNRIISNNQNSQAEYANISIDNGETGSIIADRNEILLTRVSNRFGSINLDVTNAGEIASGGGSAAFEARGAYVSITGSNGAGASITAAGDVFHAYARGAGNAANVYIGAPIIGEGELEPESAAAETPFINNGLMAAYGGSVFATTEDEGEFGPYRSGAVSINVENGETGSMYGAESVFDAYAYTITASILNSGDMTARQGVINLYSAGYANIDIRNESGASIALGARLGEYEGAPVGEYNSAAIDVRAGGYGGRSKRGGGGNTVSITNSGTISALVGGEEVQQDDGPLASVGNVEIYADGTAVDVEASNAYVTVVNDGTILAGYNGISIRGIEGEFDYAADNVVSVTNTGEILANDHGVQVFNEQALYFGSRVPPAPGEYGATTYINNSGDIAISEGGEFSEAGHAGIEVYASTNSYVSGEVILETAPGDFPSYPGQANVDIVNSGSVTGGEYGVLVNTASYVEVGAEVAYDGSNGGVLLGGTEGRYAYGYTNVVVSNAQSGTIRALNGVYVDGDNNAYIQVTNSGSITATNGDGVDLDANLVNSIVVSNSGDIGAQGENDSEGVTIDAEYAGSVTVENTGSATIMAVEDGVDIDGEYADSILVANRGASQITSYGAEGVNIDFYEIGSATIINETGADITSYNNAIDVYAEYAGSIAVTNSGSVRTTGSDGEILQIFGSKEYAAILVETGYGANSITVANTGEVVSQGGEGIAVMDGYNGPIWNMGSAQPNEVGEVAVRSTITVQNDGLVSSYRTGVDVVTSYANDVVVNNSSSGTIFSEYGAGVAVNAYGRLARIICSEEVCEASPNTIVVTNDGEIAAYGSGVDVRMSGYADVTVSNTGSIYSYDGTAGVLVSDGKRRIMRQGVPDEVGQMLIDSSVSVDNSGSIEAADGDGVEVYAGSASSILVTNSGDIYAGFGSGILASNGGRYLQENQVSPQTGGEGPVNPDYRPSITVENTGTIDAAYLGISTYGERFFFGIPGAPSPEGAQYGFLGTDISVTNGTDGVINSGFAGVIAGAYRTGDVTVVNDGAIYAGGEINRRGPLFIYNAGILAGGYQVNGSVSVTNNGTVEAAYGFGVAAFAYRSGEYSEEGQSISVVNTGQISGGYAGVAAGVLFAVPAAPEVQEDVQQPRFAGFDVSVYNSGSITASADAEYSVGVVVSQGMVTNTGDITGGAIGVLAYAGYDDVVTNDGGTITGAEAAVSTGGGNDIVNAIGNAVFNGVVDGGEGSLTIFGPQQAVDDDPNDLDILNLNAFSGPSFTPLNFEEVNIVNGSSLTLDSMTTFGGGALLIDGTSVVNSFGVTNGLQFASIDNRGTLNLQDGNAGDTLNTTGSFTSSGTIAVDVDPQGGTQDTISNTGGAANVGGDVNVNLTSSPAGDSEHVIVTADGGVTDDGAALNLTDTQVTTFALRNDPNDLVLVISTDFAPQGLLDDGSEFGAYLNANQNDPALADIFTLAQGAQSVQELQALYGTLNGIDFSQSINAGLQGGMSFGSGLFSCAVGEGQFAAIDEGQCGWTRIGGSYFDRDVDGANPGVEETVFSVSTGGQAIYDENIRLGAGIGIDLVDSEGSNGLDADSTRIHAGVSVKYVEGQMMAGVSLSAGYAFNDSERRTPLGTAEADFDTFDFSAIARAAYLADLGDGVYVKPQLQAGVHYVDRDGFTETGAGAANLQVLSEDEVFVSFSPSIEIGADLESGETKIRPFLRVGATVLSEDDVQTTARLAGAASATTFTTTAETGNVFGDVAAGVTVFADDQFTVRAEYNGRFSDDVMEHGGFLKVQYNF